MKARLRCVARAAALCLGAMVAGAAPVPAVEVPLSRASFDRALEEGRRCRLLSDAGTYVVVHRKGTESVLAAALEGTLQELLDDSIEQTFVTVRLATPYTRVASKACEAHLTGSALDVEDLWRTMQASSIVTLMVEMETHSTTNDASARADKAVGIPPTTSRLPGPGVTDVSLRRGAKREGPVTRPVSLVGGVEYVFPATALQGEGPFYALVHAEAPRLDLALKLKRSVLAKP